MQLYPKGYKNIPCHMVNFFKNRTCELKYFVSLQLIIFYSFKY